MVAIGVIRDHPQRIGLARVVNMQNRQSGAQRPTKTVRFPVKLLVVFGGVVIGLLIAEVVLRLVGYTYPVFYTTDQERGHSLRPGMEGWYRKEGEAYVRINSAGLRDREHTRAKPAGVLRIAVLGDSYAEALQVPQENAFWAVMERKLKECERLAGERRVEVINFGVSGYGTTQELITLREHVWAYAPDIVVLTVTTNNDITDNSRALKKTDEAPYFIYREGELTLDDSFRETRAFRLRQSTLNRLGRWIRDTSRVIQAIHQGHHALKALIASRRATTNTPQTNGATNAAAQTAAAEELGIDNLIYREPADPVWNDAWHVTEALLSRMRDEVRQGGAKFLVVTLSNGIQVHPEKAAREAFMRRVGASDLFYPDRRIKALGERKGFEVLNLAPALQDYAERNRVFLHGFGGDIGNGHWNATGHAVAGEMLAQALCQRGEAK